MTAGGTERTAAELANYLIKKNVDVTIVLMFKEKRFFEINKNVEIREPRNYRGRLGKIGYIPYLLYYLRREIKKINPDRVLCLGYILFGLIASLNIKTKVFISFRTSPVLKRFGSNVLANAFYNILHFFVKKRIDGMIAQTEIAKNIYSKKYKCEIAVIPNFLREIHSHTDKEKGKYIITVGRCVPEKAQHYLIKAFSMIQHDDWELIILGDGPLKKDLETEASVLPENKRVTFLGFKKNVDEYLSQSSIFVLTSIVEGYPNALLEAMANGVAPISFNCIAGPSDIIKNGTNGYLVEPRNFIDLSNKINLLIENDDLRQKIQNNALNVKINNNRNKIFDMYYKFIFKNRV